MVVYPQRVHLCFAILIRPVAYIHISMCGLRVCHQSGAVQGVIFGDEFLFNGSFVYAAELCCGPCARMMLFAGECVSCGFSKVQCVQSSKMFVLVCLAACEHGCRASDSCAIGIFSPLAESAVVSPVARRIRQV